MKVNINLTWKAAVLGLVALVILGGVTLSGVENYTGTSEFCGGACHTMDEQYTGWKNSKHYAANSSKGTQAECIECHFVPGGKKTMKAKFEGLRHLAAYLYDDKAPLPIHPKVPDGACLRSGCHDTGTLQDKELKLTGVEKDIRFKHKVHLGDKALDGQKLNCSTCHFKVTKEKHFEVPKEVCFLCHFKPRNSGEDVGPLTLQKVNFSEGPSKCENCHTIPTKSLQAQLDENDKTRTPISHQTIQKSGTPCESCHFDIVKGAGEVSTSNVNAGGCLKCHNSTPDIKAKATDKKLMHDKHVATRSAGCFECHEQIKHKAPADHLQTAREQCTLCHEDQHKYQKILLTGAPVTDAVPGVPMLMDKVKLNCMGCHRKNVLTKTGHAVKVGSGETCNACHGDEKHDEMLKDWKDTVAKEVKGAEEVEAEALQALETAKGKASKDKLNEASEMIAKGQDVLKIVKFGNGVHNKKYSIMLLDDVFGNFEDAIDLLDSGG